MKNLLILKLIIITITFLGCSRDITPENESFSNLKDGTLADRCTVVAVETGAEIRCDDGSIVFIPSGKDGTDGEKGEAGKDGQDGQDGKDGIKGETGNPGTEGLQGEKGDKGDPGQDGIAGTNGSNGTDGTSCTVVDIPEGARIDCTDGTSVIVYNGNNGTNGTDGQNGQDGTNGIDGLSCTVTSNASGALIECEDGTSAQINNGSDGSDGSDGQDGQDGTDGTDGQDGSGTYSELALPTLNTCVTTGISPYYAKNTGTRVEVYDNDTCSNNPPTTKRVCRINNGDICWVENIQFSREGTNTDSILKMIEY
jgi:hypothetical protein